MKDGSLLVVFLIGTVTAFVISACSPTARTVDPIDTSKIAYTRDDRTDLCFALLSYYEYAAKGIAMTNVPCTPAVMKLVR